MAARTVKRIIDMTIAGSALLVLLPILAIIDFIINYERRGLVLFTHTPWGVNGKKIKVYKFRSKRADLGGSAGVAQAVENDPRVTAIGVARQRYNLEEFPQLLNVLKGDISLVGPRCQAIGMLTVGRLCEEHVPSYPERHALRLGTTGLAQIRGYRGRPIADRECPPADRLRYL